MWLLLGVSLLISNAWCKEPYWKSLFPLSTENEFRPVESDEYGHPDEPDEPMVYHWDNIYLENQGPEVIIDPYGNSKGRDSYWDDDDF